MPPIQFTATEFSTIDLSSGIERLGPQANKPGNARLSAGTNCRFTSEGGCKNRTGFEEKGDLGTSAKIDTLESMKTQVFEIMGAKSNTAVKQSLDGITWYDVGLTQTAAERSFLFPYGKNLYVLNQTDAGVRIAVSTLRVAITVASTEVEIRTGDGSEFASSGAIYIEGDEIDYTGRSTDQLTGVTNIGASHAVGTIITQTTTPSGFPKGTTMDELEGSALVGGVSSNPSTVYYSAPSSNDNPEYFYDFSNNGAGAKLLGHDVTCIKAGERVAMIGTKGGIYYSTGFEPTTGALETFLLSSVHTVNNAFCIAEMDREFAILTDEGRILPAMQTDAGFALIDDPNNPRNNMDFPVAKYIKDNKDDDQGLSWLHYDPVTRELTASIIIDGISQHFIYQRDIGAWSIDTSKPYSGMANFNSRVYAGSDSDDKVYLDRETTANDGIPIITRMVTGIMSADQRRSTVDYLNLTFGGLLSAIGQFTFRILVNGEQILEELVTAEDLINEGLMTLDSGVPIGAGTVGAQTLGSSGDPIEAFNFTYPYEFMAEGENIQIEWEIEDEGPQFELRDFKLEGESENETLLQSQ